MSTLQERLKELSMKSPHSMRKLSVKHGKCKGYLSGIIHQDRQYVTPATLSFLADEFDVSTDYLLGLSDYRNARDEIKKSLEFTMPAPAEPPDSGDAPEEAEAPQMIDDVKDRSEAVCQEFECEGTKKDLLTCLFSMFDAVIRQTYGCNAGNLPSVVCAGLDVANKIEAILW